MAYADEDEAQKFLEEKGQEFIGDSSFEESYDMAMEENDGREPSRDSFAYVFYRLLNPSYINEVDNASSASGQKPSNGRVCAPSTTAGTLVDHNCDIPNFMAEFLQTTFDSVVPQGIRGGDKTQNKLALRQFGLPSGLPGDGLVPANADGSPYKYTALEMFGYNLQYTTYNGEWDNIKVMNEARMMTNFSYLDNLKMGWDAAVNSIGSAMSGAAIGWETGWDQGGLFSAVGGFFGGAISGGTASSINTILDSSDLNVVNTKSWYRDGYGARSYGIRELSNEELVQNLLTQANLYLAKDSPPAESADQDIVDVLDGGGPTSQYIGDTEELKEIGVWKEENKEIIAVFEAHSNNCNIPASNEDIQGFNECYTNAINNIFHDNVREKERGSITTWLTGKSKSEAFREWYISNEESDLSNFNAPYNRFVCVNLNGTDKKDYEGNHIYAYDYNGNLNPACSGDGVRAPIQDGLFGNGYLDSEKPNADTRHITQNGGPFGLVMSFLSPTEKISNAALGITGLLTRISNTVLNLSFSPILEELGITEIIVSLIADLRDSIFMPLIVMFMAGGAMYVLWMAGTKRNYAEQFKNLILMVLTLLSGLVLLFKPANLLWVVDEVPSMVESAILGTIFTTGREEEGNICTASGSVAGEPGEDLLGGALTYNPNDAVRQMMCENWQVFYYSPYVYGQWGTSINTLNSAESGATTRMKNTNGGIVGDARVEMGGRKHVNNWAIYQTRKMTAGSSTTKDLNATIGQTDRNLYRIVDLQRGPNNGEGTDPSYVEQWSGNNAWDRVVTSIVSIAVAGFGMVAIMGYSLNLIEVKIVVTIMLLLMPFMFLMGLIPGQGRLKLKAYLGSIIELMIQRVFLVTLLALMLRILLGLALMANGYILLAFLSVVMSVLFIIYRKELIGLVNQASQETFGSFNKIGGREMLAGAGSAVPRSISTEVSMKKQQLRGGMEGVAAGVITAGVIKGGGIKGNVSNLAGSVKEGWDSSSEFQKSTFRNKQRRTGLGAFQNYNQAKGVGRENASDHELNLTNSELRRELQDDINSQTTEAKKAADDLKKNESLASKVEIDATTRIGAGNSPKVSKISEKMYELKKKMEAVDDKIAKLGNEGKRDRTVIRSDVASMMKSPDQVANAQLLVAKKNDLQKDYDKLAKEAARIEDIEWSRSKEAEDYRKAKKEVEEEAEKTEEEDE